MLSQAVSGCRSAFNCVVRMASGFQEIAGLNETVLRGLTTSSSHAPHAGMKMAGLAESGYIAHRGESGGLVVTPYCETRQIISIGGLTCLLQDILQGSHGSDVNPFLKPNAHENPLNSPSLQGQDPTSALHLPGYRDPGHLISKKRDVLSTMPRLTHSYRKVPQLQG